MINPATGDVEQMATPTVAAEEVEVGGVSEPLTALVTTTAVSSDSEVNDSASTAAETTKSPHAHEEARSCPPPTSHGIYRLTHRIPAGCNRSDCDYFLGINSNNDDDDLLDFTLEGRADGWIAVGFSRTPNMVGHSLSQ